MPIDIIIRNELCDKNTTGVILIICKRYTCNNSVFVVRIIDIEIDIEILFFVEYSQTCNISPVGLLFRQTRVKQHAKNITACNKKKQYVQ